MKDNSDMPGHLARRFQQIAVAVFLAEVGDAGFDLTPVQYAALATIKANPGLDQVTLAGLIAYDRTTITGVIDRLVLKGLAERRASSRDRRARELEITDEGRHARCARSRRPSNPRNASCCAGSARRKVRS
ncbi:DNA-binding MarR family transcriptional regulator [Bradyrhizobium sp. LM6.9]